MPAWRGTPDVPYGPNFKNGAVYLQYWDQDDIPEICDNLEIFFPTLATKVELQDAVDTLTSSVEAVDSALDTETEAVWASLTPCMSTASTALANAGTAQTTANTALTVAQSAIKKVEVVTFTLPTNTSTVVSISGFSSIKSIIPLPTWSGEQVYTPGVVSHTNSSVTVIGKRSRGTLLLSAGPFENTSGTFSAVVIGN